jgi:RNA polymerase sigma-70 factor (ECF subfamily)
VADAELLFTQHRQGVLRYLSRVVGRADAAQDLTQEVFLRVARVPVPETDSSGHRAWVFKFARNLALNHVRDDARRPQAAGPVEVFQPATQELSVAIGEALDALGPIDRDVFLLRESAGLNYEEIAAACDLSVEAVRGRLRRAREQLRHALDGPIRAGRRGVISLRPPDAGEHS